MLELYLLFHINPFVATNENPYSCENGTTLETAVLEGYQAVGIEYLKHYAEVAKERAREAATQL